MKFTLRKANALQTAIQEQIKAIEVTTDVSLNEFQSSESAIQVARDKLVTNDLKRAQLTKTLYGIRAQIGRANVESGVSDLLADAAYVDKRISHVKTLSESKVVDASEVIVGKLEKLRTADSARSAYGYSQTVDTGVLTAEQIEDYKSEMRELKKRKQNINDKVLELNVRTEIELDDSTVTLLQAEQLV